VNATAAVAAGELEKILKVFNLIKSTDTKLIKVRTCVSSCVCVCCVLRMCVCSVVYQRSVVKWGVV
jgi:hypothetical protein